MQVNENEIPHIDKVVEYIEYFKKLYNKLFDDKTLIITNVEVLEQHFAKHFDKLRFKMDEDLFQYNHAMVVFIVLCLAYDRIDVDDVPYEFLKKHLILSPKQTTLANDLLNLKILHKSWNHFDLCDYEQVKNYVRGIHKSIASKVLYANKLNVMNRLNLIKKVAKNLFSVTPKCLMMMACQVAENLQQLSVANKLHSHVQDTQEYYFSDYQMTNFFNWAKAETTYFQIRNFRTRILNIFYLFVFDKAARNLYTYSRAGEVPSVTAVVTSKFPSQWTSSMQHIILYGKPHELLAHDNIFIRNATLLALLEAFMKTIYSVNFSKFCVCMNFDIVKNYKHIVMSEHPIVVFAWHKFLIFAKGKLYKYKNLEDTLLAWLFHLKDENDCMLFKQISLLKICNTLCVGPSQQQQEERNEEYIEIDI